MKYEGVGDIGDELDRLERHKDGGGGEGEGGGSGEGGGCGEGGVNRECVGCNVPFCERCYEDVAGLCMPMAVYLNPTDARYRGVWEALWISTAEAASAALAARASASAAKRARAGLALMSPSRNSPKTRARGVCVGFSLRAATR